MHRLRLLALLLIALCGTTGATQAQTITIAGKNFLKDGAVWRAKGIDTETFITCARHTTGKYTALRSHWGDTKLDQMRSIFHIDTIRFYVSQVGLDPNAGVCDASYETEIVAAVKLALTKGLVVILELDWQTPTGEDKPLKDLVGMPDGRTVTAWRNLAPAFASDRRVMYELFVEPKARWSQENVQRWARGIQPVIDAVRASGAQNIILLDGLDYGRETHGMAGSFDDPLPGRWGFAVDPQFTTAFDSENDWENAFGATADRYPTIVAGYTYDNLSGCIVGASPAHVVPAFFDYLKSKNIGIVLWGDYPETLWHGYDPTALTSYDAWTGCQDHTYTGLRGGPGELFSRYRP